MKKKKNKEMSKFAKIFDIRMFLCDFVRITGAIPAMVDLRMKKIYENGKKPKGFFKGKYLVSSNHISFVDPVILSVAYASRRLGFVATKELFQIPFWGKFFKGVGCILVDKENVSMQTFKTVKERLDSGHLVAVFPEGHVSGEMAQFKSGIVMMAQMSNADIIPTLIIKRNSRWHRQVVVFGNKMKLTDYMTSMIPSIEEIDNVAKKLYEKEKELEQIYLNYINKGKKNGKK